MKLKKQQYECDCNVVCLSMLTDIPLDDLYSHFSEHYLKKEGVTDRSLIHVASSFDIELIGRLPKFWKQSGKGKAILAVDSLNKEETKHAICWDGKKVLDPSPKKTYKSLPEQIYSVLQMKNDI